MRENIVELALNETLEYLKRLNIKQHYRNLLSRYMDYHNKGIYVHFNFGALKTADYYGYYVNRYGLPDEMLNLLNDKKPYDIRMKIFDLKKKIEKKKTSINQDLRQWRNLLTELKNELSRVSHFDDIKLMQAGQSLISIYDQKIDKLTFQKDCLEKASENLRRMENQYKRIYEEFQNADVQLVIHIVKYFIKTLEKYLFKLFKNETVRLDYSMKDITNRYLENKNNRRIELYPDHEMSIFEREMIGFLDQVKRMFKIVIEKDSLVYRLTASEYYFVPRIEQRKKRESFTAEKERLFVPIQEFLNEHKGFYLLLTAMVNVERNFGDDEVIKAINESLYKLYSEKTILKYYQLSHDLRQKLNEFEGKGTEEAQYYFATEAIEKMIKDFPSLHFKHGVKEDETYNFMMRHYNLDHEKKYVYYVDEIANEEFFLTISSENSPSSKQ